MQSELLPIRWWLPFALEDTIFLVSSIHAFCDESFRYGALAYRILKDGGINSKTEVTTCISTEEVWMLCIYFPFDSVCKRNDF
jgi:hypothetical protein